MDLKERYYGAHDKMKGSEKAVTMIQLVNYSLK